MWLISAALKKMFNRATPAVKSMAQLADSNLDSTAYVLDPQRGATFIEGTVLRSGPGFYDTVVDGGKRGEITCSVLTQLASNFYGVSNSFIPLPGSKVLVYLPSSEFKQGTVVGVVPPANETEQTATSVALCFDFEAGGVEPQDFTYPMTRLNANAGRAVDIAPGSYGLINDSGYGLLISPFTVTLKTGDNAQLRLSPIDDNVRIMSGYYQHYTAGGLTQIYNDGGYITHETDFTSYQCEHSGMDGIGTTKPIFQENTDIESINANLAVFWKPIKEERKPLSRLRTFIGYLGNLFNMFVIRPGYDSEPEEGLMQCHVATSGRVMVRSAAGITLERSDRIPVPTRNLQPWDPTGDKPEDGKIDPTPKVPFEWPAEHAGARALLLDDALVWRWLQAYWHLHMHPKDFSIPEVRDLNAPADAYDAVTGGTEAYSTNNKRRALISLEDDGSIILRDAWGSEIQLRDGNIILTCSGSIQLRPNDSLVGLAGHDVVLKARNSIDVIASKNDVRVKAERNLHMLSAAPLGGSVLIESKSVTTRGVWDGKGEASNGAGIVIKAPNSAVVVDGSETRINGTRDLVLETYDPAAVKAQDQPADTADVDDATSTTGDFTGRLRINAGYVLSRSQYGTQLQDSNKSALYLNANFAFIVAPGVSLTARGSKNIGLFSGNEAMTGFWAQVRDTDETLYDLFRKTAVELDKSIFASTRWFMAAGSDEIRTLARFTYRNPDEYGTLVSYGGTDFVPIRIYEASWLAAKRTGNTLLRGVTVAQWVEEPIEETLPWPGYFEDGTLNSYFKLERFNNVDVNGDQLTRKELITKDKGSEPGSLVGSSINTYEG